MAKKRTPEGHAAIYLTLPNDLVKRVDAKIDESLKSTFGGADIGGGAKTELRRTFITSLIDKECSASK